MAGLSIGREGYGSSSRAQVSVAGFVTSHRAAHGRDQELEPGANLAEHREQFLAVPMPLMTEQLGEVPKVVSQNRIQRRTAKQIVKVVEEHVKITKVSSQNMVQQRFGEQIVGVPAGQMAEVSQFQGETVEAAEFRKKFFCTCSPTGTLSSLR